jgi:hypothetical protein
MDDNFNGLIIYDIQLNGGLSGIYTNELEDGNINLEIATKISGGSGIEGTYHSIYSQGGVSIFEAALEITLKTNRKNTLKFIWTHNKSTIFEGIGYLMNQTQIAVHYWPVN